MQIRAGSECQEPKQTPPQLHWLGGEVHTKNPDEALIEKMAEIAKSLGATLHGDDDEIYLGGHQAPYQVPPTRMERLRVKFEFWTWKLRYLRGRGERKRRMDALAETFIPGQRVKDAFGREAIVIAIDVGGPTV